MRTQLLSVESDSAYIHDHPDHPRDFFVLSNTDSFEDLVNFVYQDILHGDPAAFETRAILSSTNATIDTMNAHVLDILAGGLLAAYSFNSFDPHAFDDTAFDFILEADLNAIDVAVIPPHALNLKLNSMVMIMRNLNFKQSLVK